MKLAGAFLTGNGVAENNVVAAKWFRKAADQGDPVAENEIGIMFRVGDGVPRDKEEAVRWYAKAAKQGSPQAMFNLGACYYNGDGVASNEYSAYAWFLLAQEAGDAVANDAVKRSSATMSKRETADAFAHIGEMYDKGDDLPRSQERALLWLHKAAEIDSQSKVLLASQLLKGTSSKYEEAFDLCRQAAKDYPPGENCLGYMYRKGLG